MAPSAGPRRPWARSAHRRATRRRNKSRPQRAWSALRMRPNAEIGWFASSEFVVARTGGPSWLIVLAVIYARGSGVVKWEAQGEEEQFGGTSYTSPILVGNCQKIWGPCNSSLRATRTAQ